MNKITISEFITILEGIKAEHGDLPISFYYQDDGSSMDIQLRAHDIAVGKSEFGDEHLEVQINK